MGMLGIPPTSPSSSPASTFLYVALYKYAFRDFHHPEPVLIIAFFAMALSPAGRVLSIDSLIRNRGRPVEPALRPQLLRRLAGDAHPVVHGADVPLGGLRQADRGWFDWTNGYTLQFYLAQDGSAGAACSRSGSRITTS